MANKNNNTMVDINKVMAELSEYTELMDELKLQVEALQDQVKDYMSENDLDEVLGENGEKATFRSVVSNRFDSANFKKQYLALYTSFVHPTEYRRFTFTR